MSGTSRSPGCSSSFKFSVSCLWLAVGWLTFAGCGSQATPAKPAFKLRIESDDPAQVVVIADGPPNYWAKFDKAKWASLLWFGVSSGDEPMLGKYEVVANELRFTPSFPLAQGQSYSAKLRVAGEEITANYSLPQSANSQPKLLAIYPSGSLVPANHLKFYLVFSEPMADGRSFDHLELLNVTRGKQVVDPFRRTELWSDDGKTFTLWLHPGRQKSGVNLNVELGAILEPKEQFELVVRKNWMSQLGEPLTGDTHKKFRAGPRINKVIEPSRWKHITPKFHSRDPLRILFSRPLDWALLHSEFRVLSPSGSPVPGKIATAENEREWRFVPQQAWESGRYQVSVGAVVEDLAGNNLRRPFEVDVRAVGQEKQIGDRLSIPFAVK